MDRSFSILVFLVLAVAVTHAALPSQVYWNNVLPNTPMPSAIRDLFNPDVLDQKAGTSVNVGKGGVHVDAGKGKPGGTTVDVGHKGVGVNAPGNTHVGVGGGGVDVNTGKGKPGGTTVDVGHQRGVGVSVGGHGGTRVGVGRGRVGVVTGPRKKPPVVVDVRPGYGPFLYNYAATQTQIHDDPNVALFFLEKDLFPGAKINLHFTRTTSASGATLLPRAAANSIPFSSDKLPEILTRFSVQPHSAEAEAMKKTLQECEEPASAAGESKYCATSLESMVDFATSSLGTRNVRAVSTSVDKEGTPEQQYTVAASGAHRVAAGRTPTTKSSSSSSTVTCHAQTYAYAVFYCHVTRASRAYVVPLVGKDGTKVEAVAVCHTDTSTWNPGHLAFQVLKVKPGTVPICHFLPQDHVVWVPNN